MQRKTISRKRFGRSVTVRLESELYDQLATRADDMAKQNPGLQVTVSDVIRSILIQTLERQRLETKSRTLVAEAVQARVQGT